MTKILIRIGMILLLAVTSLSAMALDIIPCSVGNKWEYDTIKLMRASINYQDKVVSAVRDASSGTSVYEVLLVDSKANPPVYEYRESTSLWPVDGGKADTDTTELKITNDAKGLCILSTSLESTGEDKPEKQNYDPPLLYFSQLAEKWDVGAMRDGNTRNFMTAYGASRETVTVPAGAFKDCLKVVYVGDQVTGTVEMWDKTFTITSGKSRGIYWIADGVGVVKELEVSSSTSEAPGPDGKIVTVEAASCTISELKPGYVVKK